MKYPFLFIVLLTQLIVLTTACNKDEPILEQESTQTEEKLIRVNRGGTDTYRFYYDGETLIEFQQDYWVLDPSTNEPTLRTKSNILAYNDDRLEKITNESTVITYEYPENDMVVKSFHSQFPDAVMVYKNYQNTQTLRVEVDYQDDLSTYFNTNFDLDGNFLFAQNDINISVEDAFPGFYFMSPYYGTYMYNENQHPFKNFPLEIQLALHQLPVNNCVNSIIRNNKRIEYTYEFNEDGFPTKQWPITIYPASNDTLDHGLVEYFYE